MILDSSAIVAIVLDEPERAELLEKLDAAALVAVGAPTLVEAAIVLTARMGHTGAGALEAFLGAADVIIIEFSVDHWREAATAWSRYGRGRHDAGLNFGDCLAYAVARSTGFPLLAKGDDFPRTDLLLA